MLLQEILSSPYAFKLKKYDDGMAASFKNANGDKVGVSFFAYHIPETGWAYEISFVVNDSFELTGEGDEFRTFATVFAIVDEFMKKKMARMASMVPILVFSTANSKSRTKLYKKLFAKLATKYHFSIVDHTALPPKIQEWWKHVDLDGDDVIIACVDYLLKLYGRAD